MHFFYQGKFAHYAFVGFPLLPILRLSFERILQLQLIYQHSDKHSSSHRNPINTCL